MTKRTISLPSCWGAEGSSFCMHKEDYATPNTIAKNLMLFWASPKTTSEHNTRPNTWFIEKGFHEHLGHVDVAGHGLKKHKAFVGCTPAPLDMRVCMKAYCDAAQ